MKYSKKIDDILIEGKKCKEKYGNIGPTGPKGDSENIKIRKTETTEPGTEAVVIDTLIDKTHILDFKIPKGSIGPTGPTGPLPRSVFGYKFSDAGNIVNLEDDTFKEVELNRTGEVMGIINTGNAFTINEDGIYKIEYFFSASSSVQTALFTEIWLNGEFVEGSEVSKDVIVNNDTDFHSMTVTRAKKGDIINLVVKTRKASELTTAPDTNAFLYISKLA